MQRSAGGLPFTRTVGRLIEASTLFTECLSSKVWISLVSTRTELVRLSTSRREGEATRTELGGLSSSQEECG